MREVRKRAVPVAPAHRIVVRHVVVEIRLHRHERLHADPRRPAQEVRQVSLIEHSRRPSRLQLLRRERAEQVRLHRHRVEPVLRQEEQRRRHPLDGKHLPHLHMQEIRHRLHAAAPPHTIPATLLLHPDSSSAAQHAGTKKGPAEPREASHSKWCRRPDLNRYVVANGRF